jgi:hypothetical protein
MRRRRCWLVAPLGLLLTTAPTVATLGNRQEPGPGYSVKELRMSLQHAPERWVGRTVRVRGTAVRCSDPSGGPHCLYEQARLLGRWGAPAPESLPLEWDGSSPPLVAALRQLPLLGQLMPAPQVLRWGAVATYRVQIRALPITSCGNRPCYEAVVLDAAPDAPWEG